MYNGLIDHKYSAMKLTELATTTQPIAPVGVSPELLAWSGRIATVSVIQPSKPAAEMTDEDFVEVQ
jgi:hypothetical protein